jgi:hypothetical protein
MKAQWQVRGVGPEARLEASCSVCGNHASVENATLNTGLLHCGRLERVPEKMYERFCELRDVGSPRVPVTHTRFPHLFGPRKR